MTPDQHAAALLDQVWAAGLRLSDAEAHRLGELLADRIRRAVADALEARARREDRAEEWREPHKYREGT